MNPIIAVILDQQKTITSINLADTYCLYQKEGVTWKEVQVISHPASSQDSIVMAREYIRELCNLLGDCRILVGTEILGLPFHILDSKGFFLCEANEINDALLNSIWTDYEESHNDIKTEDRKSSDKEIKFITPTSPVPTDENGNYYIDLDLTLKSHPTLSSKKVLLPFLDKTLFDTLIVDTNHVMPWLDGMLPSCLSYRTESIDDGRKRIAIYMTGGTIWN
jgi:Fe-only nitrogenase accessory protein AnfO